VTNTVRSDVIDRLRKEIQDRLEQLLAEAEKLRKALSALDPRAQPSPAPKARSRAAAERPPGGSASQTKRRTPPGATKARVLQALSDGQARTAGEVAAATGLGRGTVSTTLTKLAQSGELDKAERGYALPAPRSTAAGRSEPPAPSA
jgi:DNA-binding transcriptional ArsR family regulator